MFAIAGAVPDPSSGPEAPASRLSAGEIIHRYLEATEKQKARVEAMSMEVSIDAELPRLSKQGTLQALRQVSRVGKITYDAVRFAGDKVIKNDVIARYLKAELEAANGNGTEKNKPEEEARKNSMAVTPANYKFKLKGTSPHAGRTAYVFQVSPRKKRIGLFKGELWVDTETFLPLREWGEFVKNPSIFLRKVEFVRDFYIQDGVAVPWLIHSTIHTRVVGKAELDIEFRDVNYVERGPLMVSPLGW